MQWPHMFVASSKPFRDRAPHRLAVNERQAFWSVMQAKEKPTFKRSAAAAIPANDLSKIAARIPDPKRLQDAWLAGGTRRRKGGARKERRPLPAR